MPGRSRGSRCAFTIVELLVLIAIIAFLLALLGPALLTSRCTGSRRSACQNNLKQYGLALHNYNDIHGSLPSGFVDFDNDIVRPSFRSLYSLQRVGWQVRILPFMEQSVIYDQLSGPRADGRPADRIAQTVILNDGLPAAQHNFPAAKCPTDPFPSINPNAPKIHTPLGVINLSSLATSSYEGSMGAQQLQAHGGCNLGAMGLLTEAPQPNVTTYNQFSQGGRSFPRADPTRPGVPFINAPNGVLPAIDFEIIEPQPARHQLSGVFSANGYGVRFNEVTDGLSNTIFVGEVLPECTGALQAGWWPLASDRPTNVSGGSVVYARGTPMASTVVPLNTFVTCPKIETRQKRLPHFGGATSSGCINNINSAAAFGFKSRHPGVCQFVFGDGSVRSLSEGMDHGVYQLLGAKADGVSIPAYE